jgi:hypothetical protein
LGDTILGGAITGKAVVLLGLELGDLICPGIDPQLAVYTCTADEKEPLGFEIFGTTIVENGPLAIDKYTQELRQIVCGG